MSDTRADAAREWLRLAARPSVIRRGCVYAVIVGTVLITINHGDAILAGELSGDRLWKMGLTAMVPYFVSTLSSVGATRSQMARQGERDSAAAEAGTAEGS